MFLLCFLEGECGKGNIEPPIEDAYSPLFWQKWGHWLCYFMCATVLEISNEISHVHIPIF